MSDSAETLESGIMELIDSSAKPPYADFCTAEYQSRVARAQEVMHHEGLDVLILTQRENVEYFSGFMTGHWSSKTFATGAVLLHREHSPILVIPEFFDGTASKSSWINDRALFPECHARPRGFSEFIIAGINKLRATTGTIGLESGENLAGGWNLEDLFAVTSAFPAAEFTSAQKVIWACRSLKSEAEMSRMRQLVAWTDEAIGTAFRNTSPGSTEIDIAYHIKRSGVDSGADGSSILNIRAGLPRYPCSDSLPTDRAIVEGDMLLVDAGLAKNLYQTDVAYVAHVGRPTSTHQRFYDAVIRSHEAILAALRPGVRACDVYEAGRKVLEEFGDGKYIDMMGHGIGMDMHEPPIITPYSTSVIQPGMLFAIEPWLYDTQRLGVFCVEELVYVTDDGIEVLSTIPRDELRLVGA